MKNSLQGKMMKVLLVDQILRVNHNYSISLANALADQGVDITIVGDDLKVPDCGYPVLSLFNTSSNKASKLEKVLNYINSWRVIYRTALESSVDVLHVQWFQLSCVDAFFISLLAKRGIKTVVTIHDILPFDEKPFDKFFIGRIYSIAHSIIVQAKANENRVVEMFPQCLGKVSFIPHGNFTEAAKPIEKDLARAKLELPADRIIVLFFGQIKKVKGVDLLLQSFSMLLREMENPPFLLIAGNCWKTNIEYYHDIINEKRSIYESNLRFDARFIPDEDVHLFFSAADFCVLPYRDIYQSGVIQLCYAYKKPVVASNLPAFQEIVEDGVNGFLFESGNPRALCESLKTASLCEFLPRMGYMGYNKVVALFSWDVIAQKVIRCYSAIEEER